MNANNIRVKVIYEKKNIMIGTGYQTEQQIINAIRDRIDSLKSQNSILIAYQSGAKSLQEAYQRCIQNKTTSIKVIVKKYHPSMCQDQQDGFQCLNLQKSKSYLLLQQSSPQFEQKQTQFEISGSRLFDSTNLLSQSVKEKKKMLRYKGKKGENIAINFIQLETQKDQQFLNKNHNNNKNTRSSGQFEEDIQNKHKQLCKKPLSNNLQQILTAVNDERYQRQSTTWDTYLNKKEPYIQIPHFIQNNENYQKLNQLQVSSIVQNNLTQFKECKEKQPEIQSRTQQQIIQRLIARIQQVQNAFRQQSSQFNVILREQSIKISFLESQNQNLKLKLEQVQDSNLKILESNDQLHQRYSRQFQQLRNNNIYLLHRLNQIQKKYLKLSSQNYFNQEFSANISPQDISAFKNSSIQKSILGEKKDSIKSNAIQWTAKESKRQTQQIFKTQIKNLDAQMTQIQKLPSIKAGDIVQFKINIKNNGLQRWPQKIFIHERVSNKISQLKSLSSGETINFADQPITAKRQGQNIQIKYQLFYEAENSEKRYFGNVLSIFHKVKRNDGSKIEKMKRSLVMDKNPSNYSNSNLEKKMN